MTVMGIDELEVLQPFGQGNKKPLLGVCGVCMRNRARVGATANHLRFFASDGVSSVPAIMFRTPDIERAANCEEAVDLVFEAVNETWQGRTKPKLMVRDILYRNVDEAPLGTQVTTIADDLFERAEQILVRDAYAGIAEATTFVTKVVGVTFEGRQAVVSSLSAGQELVVVREPHNPVDANAIALFTLSGPQVGFLRRQIAAASPDLDGGMRYSGLCERRSPVVVRGAPMGPTSRSPARTPNRNAASRAGGQSARLALPQRSSTTSCAAL